MDELAEGGHSAPANHSKPHFHGHRERLRRRLLEQGPGSLSDYEVIEFLLFGAKPRGDVKPLAKALIAQFGSLAGVLSAAPRDLQKVPGMGDASTAALLIIREAATRLARTDILEQPVIESWTQLVGYCRSIMGRSSVEHFRVLFLDRKNRLIADEEQQRGTVDHTPVYPREVVKRALELSASAVILVHNHPSGDATPSQGDIDMTKEIRETARRMGIELHDHLIVTRSGESSFRSLGLI
ncbi:RadC family protein [Denitrobaculum tricleocarpae]|uniref:JAB domain-containing protein n=1 Tax=Denitrobaculum tricleocarpae TaxID=2591009 RepID=A0A545T1X2_9PROT|nr:DNA repair protein RadC [Denitrobaculum tricleocarpae]TQV71227.1 JAB domain-containing protein [Denitrobaculum tricleocarpae]